MSKGINEFAYCPRCDANLMLQKGYDHALPYWTCKGCGEMLLNPALETELDIVWICDGCGATLNVQPGFTEQRDEWICADCGFVNKIAPSEVYASEEEYQAALANPYKGLSDDDVLKLSMYQEEEQIDGRCDIIRVKHRETGETFIKKLLWTYDRSIYEYLMDNPVPHMPHVRELYESDKCLIVIEEYIEGISLAEFLDNISLPEVMAIQIAKKVCETLSYLHSLPTPIIHRDIKPSNIILTVDKDVVLLDMNVAKWFNPDKNDDTRYLGTRFYAAPEQVGYGLSASSGKADIYAVGILLNFMITGKFIKEEQAQGKIWNIIERCISLDAKDRYTAAELWAELDKIERNEK